MLVGAANDDRQQFFDVNTFGCFRLGFASGSGVRVQREFDQLPRDVGRSPHEIDRAGIDGAAGHAEKFGASLVLGEGDAALAFDGFQTESAVATGAREDHANGPFLLFVGE